jgi:hypothetical protein
MTVLQIHIPGDQFSGPSDCFMAQTVAKQQYKHGHKQRLHYKIGYSRLAIRP